MEISFHTRQNGMTPFHSSWNGMSSPFWPEWNDHSIPDRMEWLHSIPTRTEWALHSNQIEHSNLAGLECHSFDNLKISLPGDDPNYSSKCIQVTLYVLTHKEAQKMTKHYIGKPKKLKFIPRVWKRHLFLRCCHCFTRVAESWPRQKNTSEKQW